MIIIKCKVYHFGVLLSKTLFEDGIQIYFKRIKHKTSFHISLQEKHAKKSSFFSFLENTVNKRLTLPQASNILFPLFFRAESTILTKSCCFIHNSCYFRFLNVYIHLWNWISFKYEARKKEYFVFITVLFHWNNIFNMFLKVTFLKMYLLVVTTFLIYTLDSNRDLSFFSLTVALILYLLFRIFPCSILNFEYLLFFCLNYNQVVWVIVMLVRKQVCIKMFFVDLNFNCFAKSMINPLK